MSVTPDVFFMFLILYAIIFVTVKYGLKPILDYIRGKPQAEDEAPDILRLIYKKRKKAAKCNKRRISRRLMCEGDRELAPVFFRHSGMMYGTSCADAFWKHTALSEGQWTIIPVRLIREYTRRTLRIKCRGFIPWGENLWIPELTIYDAKDRDVFLSEIWSHFCHIVNMEGAIIQQHLRINGISTASLTREINALKLRMMEALPRVGDEMEEVQQ